MSRFLSIVLVFLFAVKLFAALFPNVISTFIISQFIRTAFQFKCYFS